MRHRQGKKAGRAVPLTRCGAGVSAIYLARVMAWQGAAARGSTAAGCRPFRLTHQLHLCPEPVERIFDLFGRIARCKFRAPASQSTKLVSGKR
jgi:hypothetical protein